MVAPELLEVLFLGEVVEDLEVRVVLFVGLAVDLDVEVLVFLEPVLVALVALAFVEDVAFLVA